VKLRTLHARYLSEVSAEIAKHPARPTTPITAAEVERLPAPVRRFFHSSGFIGRPHTLNARIVWQSMKLRHNPRARWLTLRSEQFASVPEPTRIALMTTRLGGVVPFEGLDQYREGHGQMLIELAKVFTVADSRGRYMDESALVTVLSEALFTPSVAMQDYVEWTAIDERSASARLRDRGLSVTGVFHFNEADELIRFDTNDRWRDGKPPTRMAWSANVASYQRVGGVRLPLELSATWHEPAGDFTYVQGALESITFNVER
jgi:hypothetical protein